MTVHACNLDACRGASGTQNLYEIDLGKTIRSCCADANSCSSHRAQSEPWSSPPVRSSDVEYCPGELLDLLGVDAVAAGALD